jgi:hypothetical protein
MMDSTKRIFQLTGLGLLAALWLGATGCQSFSTSPASSLTSVTITNRPMADVQAAVARVFAAHLFDNVLSQENQFTFTRPGTSADQMAYGSRTFHRPLTVKVVVTTQSQGADTIIVGCKAWVIESENDPTFREIHTVRSFDKQPYEDLLQEVKTQLGE